MKTKILLSVIVFTASILIISCKKDNDDNPAKPVINLLELGEGDSHGNEHIAKIGGELHIEAEIVAEGKINKVNVILHPEGGHGKKSLLAEWEIDTTYTKFAGLKNTLFHEHLEIDTIAEPGTYHFDFIVTDMEGNQSSYETDVKLEK